MTIVKTSSNFFDFKQKFLFFLRRSYIFLILLIIYVPLIIIVLLSFNGQTSRGNIIMNYGIPTTINYLELFKDNDFLNALSNSLIISLFVVPISLLIALITCVGIWNSKIKYSSPIIGISKVSIAIPEPITAISLALLFTSVLFPLGFDFGIFTVCLAHITFCTPYAIISIFPKMQKMPKNLVLASCDLGYSKLKTFFKIVIPYLIPALLSAGAITLAISLDDFVITNLINGTCQTISTAIYSTRKGIKAWVVTFGAIVILITFIIMMITILPKIKNNKKIKNKKEKSIIHYENK